MKIKIRTHNSILSSVVEGEVAERLLTAVLQYTKSVIPKDLKKKAFKMTEDMAFTITNDVKVMLYKDFLLIVEY